MKSYKFFNCNPLKCEEKLNALVLQLNQIISHWERIVKDDGGIELLLDNEQSNFNFGSVNNIVRRWEHDCWKIERINQYNNQISGQWQRSSYGTMNILSPTHQIFNLYKRSLKITISLLYMSKIKRLLGMKSKWFTERQDPNTLLNSCLNRQWWYQARLSKTTQ